MGVQIQHSEGIKYRPFGEALILGQHSLIKEDTNDNRFSFCFQFIVLKFVGLLQKIGNRVSSVVSTKWNYLMFILFKALILFHTKNINHVFVNRNG